jgi:hypothetical protein
MMIDWIGLLAAPARQLYLLLDSLGVEQDPFLLRI